MAVNCPSWPRIEGVSSPFITLDAEHIDHSGTVLIVCADPRMVAGANHPEPSRVQQLVTRTRNDPQPGCAGLTHFYKPRLDKLARQGVQTPYFELQRQLLEKGIERFARRVAALTKRRLVVEANYVDFGTGGSVVQVTSLRTVEIKATKNPQLLPLGDFEGKSGFDGSTWI